MTEAIVVVGVLLVLGVCVVSSASVARGNSKNSTCLNNLSRIGYANLIYAAQDPSDPALPVHAQFTQDPNTWADLVYAVRRSGWAALL